MVKSNYKYLGTILNRELSIDKYVDYINMRVLCLCKRMCKVRKLGRLPLKLLVIPIIKMMANSATIGNSGDLSNFLRNVRSWLKTSSFCQGTHQTLQYDGYLETQKPCLSRSRELDSDTKTGGKTRSDATNGRM